MKLYCIITAIALFGIGSLVAQPLSGTKTIPGDYASIRLAVIALNTNGVTSPGVTFNIASGYLENINLSTTPIIVNTNTGSASSPIVFQKVAGGVVNPVISAGTGGWGENTNAGITIAGTDYVTIDGIDVQAFDNSLEFGYSLLKKSNTAPFDGCQNVIIRNCKITLNKTNSYAVGIYTGNHIYTSTNALTITSTTDAHNNCKFS
jgi:hypothetical protein